MPAGGGPQGGVAEGSPGAATRHALRPPTPRQGGIPRDPDRPTLSGGEARPRRPAPAAAVGRRPLPARRRTGARPQPRLRRFAGPLRRRRREPPGRGAVAGAGAERGKRRAAARLRAGRHLGQLARPGHPQLARPGDHLLVHGAGGVLRDRRAGAPERRGDAADRPARLRGRRARRQRGLGSARDRRQRTPRAAPRTGGRRLHVDPPRRARRVRRRSVSGRPLEHRVRRLRHLRARPGARHAGARRARPRRARRGTRR